MDYYYKVFSKFIKPKSKYKHKKSNTHKTFNKCKRIKLSVENPDISNVDRAFFEYINVL